MISFQNNNILFLSSNYPALFLRILEYLAPKDLETLSLICKVLHNNTTNAVNANLEQLKLIWQNNTESSGSSEEESEEEAKEAKEIEKKKKQKKNASKLQGFWPKKNIFSVEAESKNQISNFKFYDLKEKSLKFTQNFEEKFLKENQSLIFVDEKKTNVVVLNRCLLDKSLNYENLEDKQEAEKYNELFQSEDFGSKNFDFSNMTSLLERQKKILENIKNKEKQQEDQKTIAIDIKPIFDLKRITIILCHGGYFAVGVFEKDKCILHKSDHKYVVRKKAGKRQITRDSNSGSHIQSMGSQIRRDQEKKHYEKIKKILSDCYKTIEPSDLILYHAPAMNRYLILGENEPLYPLRKKFRSVCLTTKRANYTEIERIFNHISKIYIIPSDKALLTVK